MLPSRTSASSRAPRLHLATALAVGASLGLAGIGGIATSAAALDIAPVAPIVSPSDPSTQTQSLGSIAVRARTTLEVARSAAAAAADARGDVAASGLDVAGPAAVDTRALSDQISRLSSLEAMPLLLVPDLTDDTLAETRKVTELTGELRTRLDIAQKKADAKKAAAEAKAKKKRAAKKAAAALAAANTVEGAKATARSVSASDYGWGADQFACLDSLWTKESGWNYQAYNASSGATGIPQALPGSKMATAGADWQSSAATQIRWGLGYIAAAYGTPCSAWGHSQATNWY